MHGYSKKLTFGICSRRQLNSQSIRYLIDTWDFSVRSYISVLGMHSCQATAYRKTVQKKTGVCGILFSSLSAGFAFCLTFYSPGLNAFYIGCFVDGSVRDLDKIVIENSGGLTIEKCITDCRGQV